MTIKLIFYFFAATLVFAASRVITVRNPVHAALFLVLAFFSSAAIWLLLQAEFLAIALILIYVGAVMILFLFVVMMLDINFAPLREGFAKYLPVGLLVGFLILVEMILVVTHWKTNLSASATVASTIPNTKMLGQVLYSLYVYPFEIAAVILLVAMIAAIALTMRSHTRAKYQKPEQQVRVRREDRIRLINMPAEPKD
jgi:NADH-quinone oxidoreductase subunit J